MSRLCVSDWLTTGRAETQVGETLEAMGEFNKAAKQYELASMIGADPAQSIEFAAIAYKRGGDCERAETTYIRVLHMRAKQSRDGNLDIFSKMTDDLLNNWLSFFDYREKRLGARTAKIEDGEVYCIFIALLSVAGFRPVPQFKNLFDYFAKVTLPIIQSNLKKKKKAMNLLSKAVSQPEKEHFVAVLAGCVPAGLQSRISSLENHDEREERAQSLNIAKLFVTDNMVKTDTWTKGCGYPSCSRRESPNTITSEFLSRKLMQCPCEAITYCDSTCQKAHWVQHRGLCSWYAKKQRDKKKKSG